MTDHSIVLSIIMPVYNLELFLDNSIKSIVLQNCDKRLFELIIINDGSTDQSLSIIKKYGELYNNIVVLEQYNNGVSVARNNGIKNAKGTFVTFIDGDDQMINGSLSNIIDLLLEKNDLFDLCYCQSFILGPNSNSKEEIHRWQDFFTINKVYSGTTLLHKGFINGGSVCGGIYRRDFLIDNRLFFGEKISNCEDTIFNYLLYSKNPRVSFTAIPFISITVREGSASRSPSIERVKQFRIPILYLKDIEKENERNDIEQQVIHASYYHIISMATNMYISLGRTDWKSIQAFLDIKELPKLWVPWFSYDRKIKIALLNYCFPLYFHSILVSRTLFYKKN